MSERERRDWIDEYLCGTAPSVASDIVECAVCAPRIAEGLLNGRDAFALSPEVKELLRARRQAAIIAFTASSGKLSTS